MPDLKLFLFQQSVSFLSPNEDGELDLSSGTLVSIGSRLFVATASHTVPSNPSVPIWILNEQPRNLSASYPAILKRGNRPRNNPDVGFLELDPSSALQDLHKQACPIDRIADVGVGRPLRSTILTGNPGEYVKFKQYVIPGTTGPAFPAVVPVIIAYYTVPLLESEWPVIHDPSPAADSTKDIFLDYPKTPGEVIETGERINLPSPKGMSGGGLWDQGFEAGSLWVKESAKLIGIQSSWHPGLRYARAVQIRHWLRLIHEEYSDLQSILESSFPRLIQA